MMKMTPMTAVATSAASGRRSRLAAYSLSAMPLILLVVVVLVAGVRAADHCKLCADHVMCVYKDKGQGGACRNYAPPTLDAKDRKAILREHNVLRNWVAIGLEKRGKGDTVQPSASNMRKVRWDDEIASFAQRLADQCVYQHDKCRSSKDGTRVGQNIWISFEFGTRSAKPQWKNATLSWYGEVDLRDGALNTKRMANDGSYLVTGHYTQMVWAKTAYVGCGYSTYDSDNGFHTTLVVCNYKPAGNVVGKVTYKPGPATSACPASTKKHKKYPGLCG